MLFEAINGVDGQFHSCADVFLPLYFEFLRDPKTHNIMFEILQHIIANIESKIKPQHTELLWTTLLSVLDDLFKTWTSNHNTETATVIDSVLKLTGQAIEYKEGKFLCNHTFVQQLLKFDLDNLPDAVLLTYSKIMILLLLGKNVKLPQEQASSITRKILNVNKRTVLLYFVENVCSYSSFEALILPSFLKQCISNDLDYDSFRVLTKLVLTKAPLCISGMNLGSWNKYPLDFGSKESNLIIKFKLESYVLIEDVNKIFENIENWVCSLICLPHLTVPLDVKFEELILSLISVLHKSEEESNNEKQQKMLFMVNVALECAIHININNLSELANVLFEFLLNTISDKNCLIVLKCLDLLLSAVSHSNIISMDTLLKLNAVLEKNFTSPYHEVSRLLQI